MRRTELEHILKRYMPEGVVGYATDYLIEHRIQLRITPPRRSKFGDYRPPLPGENHRISVNSDLNMYAFTVTFFHEIAHLTNWSRHANRVNPHGPEWKQEFREIMLPLARAAVLPTDINQALHSYLAKPSASTCSDPQLFRTLRKYDSHGKKLVEELPEGTRFVLGNGLVLQKGARRRTRYECLEIRTGRTYLVPGLAVAEFIDM
jgi:SprT protein